MISTSLRTAGAGSSWNRVQMATQAVNRNAGRMESGKRKNGEERKEDRVQLNPMKQAESILDHLMNQKQNLIDQKNQLIADTLGAGGDIGSIQSLISLYDEQISNIDIQISQTMKDMVERQLEQKEEKEEKEPETKEEQQIRQMSKLSDASMDYEMVNQIHSAYGRKKREASIMASEISLDNSRGGTASGKTERLAEVLEEADALYTDAMKGYVDLNVEMKEEEAENIRDQQQLESKEYGEETQGDSLLQSVRDMADDEKNQDNSEEL